MKLVSISHISDLPKDLIRDISAKIHLYSTGLIKVTKDEKGKENAKLLGSGTLVQIEDTRGILTAQHVTQLISQDCSLGLTTHPDGIEHKNQIKSLHLNVVEIARPRKASEGPDLSFIGLPPVEANRIATTKVFYNLSKRRLALLSAPPDPNRGVWFIWGIPDEKTTNENSDRGFDSLRVFHVICGAGGVNRTYSIIDHDYFEMNVSYARVSDVPMSFGGVSGGGLWQVPLFQRQTGDIVSEDVLFSGVAFYQTEIKDSIRSIVCHGRKSIYQVAYELIVQKTAKKLQKN